MEKTRRGTTQNLSDTQFKPGGALRVAELVQALSFIKGAPLDVTSSESGGPAGSMEVKVQAPASLATEPTPPIYDYSSTELVNLSDELLPSRKFTLARMGLSISAMKIDQAASVPGTAGDSASWQVKTAITSLLQSLDTLISRGSGATYLGLSAMAQSNASTGLGLEADVRLALSLVSTSGCGAGAGPDCLIGNALLLRALMATSTGMSGASGWKVDPRTGLIVFHYLGIPFYRADVPSEPPAEPTTTTLFAANLGPTGLNLVHAYGTAEGFGVQVDEQPIQTTVARRQFTVHGAWAPVTWEESSLQAITGVSLAVL